MFFESEIIATSNYSRLRYIVEYSIVSQYGQRVRNDINEGSVSSVQKTRDQYHGIRSGK